MALVASLALASPSAWASGHHGHGGSKVTCRGPNSLSGYFELHKRRVKAKRADCKTAKKVVKRFARSCFKAYATQKGCKVRAPKRWRCRSRMVGGPQKGIPSREKCKRRKSRVVFVVAYFPPTEPHDIAPSSQDPGAPKRKSPPFDEKFKCIDLRPAGTVIPAPKPPTLGNFEIHVLRGPVSVGEDLQAALVAKRVSQVLHAGLGSEPLSNPDPVPIFITDRRFDTKDSLGLHAPTCLYPNDDAIVVRTNLQAGDPSLDATAAHELFHAYSSGVARGFYDPWWEEASATWSEGKLGLGDATRWNPWLQFPDVALDYVPADPTAPDNRHQYAMWRFVQFLEVRGLIGDPAWPLERQVISGYDSPGATFALLQAITKANSSTSLGAELAAFWGDRLKEKPLRGPQLKPVSVNSKQLEVTAGTSFVKTASADRLETQLSDFTLAKNVARVEFEFDPPTDGYFWGGVASNRSERFRKDDSVTFCVDGDDPDALEWPGHFPVTFTNGSLSSGKVEGDITIHATTDAGQCQLPTPDNRACHLLRDAKVGSLLGTGSFPFASQDRDEEQAFWICFYTGSTGEVDLNLVRSFKLTAKQVRKGVRRQIDELGLFDLDGVGDVAGIGTFNDGEKDYSLVVFAVAKEVALFTLGPGNQNQNAKTLAKRLAGQLD